MATPVVVLGGAMMPLPRVATGRLVGDEERRADLVEGGGPELERRDRGGLLLLLVVLIVVGIGGTVALTSGSHVAGSHEQHHGMAEIVAADAIRVSTLRDAWVAQVASSPVGVDEQAVLQDVRARHAEDPTLLTFRSEAFAVYRGGSSWVTVVDHRFDTADEVVAWCAEHSTSTCRPVDLT